MWGSYNSLMSDSNIALRVAAKAVVINDGGKVLILREAETNPDGTNAGKYHVPGGRLEEGEAFLDGLRREVLEEAGIEIEPLHPVHVDEWRPVIHGLPHQIVGIFMLCKAVTDNVRLSEEHDHFAWVDFSDLDQFELLDAEGSAVAKASKHVLS